MNLVEEYFQVSQLLYPSEIKEGNEDYQECGQSVPEYVTCMNSIQK